MLRYKIHHNTLPRLVATCQAFGRGCAREANVMLWAWKHCDDALPLAALQAGVLVTGLSIRRRCIRKGPAFLQNECPSVDRN